MKKNSGFTLLELLVVIAIVIVLAALLFGALRTSSENAKRLKALNQIRQIGVAVNQFVADNDGELPGVAHMDSVTWSFSLRPYLGLDEQSPTKELERVFRSPGEEVKNRWYSYAINDYIGSSDLGFHRINRVPQPSQTLLFAERSKSYNQDHFHFAQGFSEAAFAKQVAAERYGNGGVYLFVDGHVEYIRWEEVRARLETTPFVQPDQSQSQN